MRKSPPATTFHFYYFKYCVVYIILVYINNSTQRAQTSATGAQFLDFQDLPLALILLFPPLFHIFADSDPDHSEFIFHGFR